MSKTTFYSRIVYLFFSGLFFLSAFFLCSTAAFAQSSYQQTIVADNPQAYWRLGETSGSTASDLLGNHTGTYLNNPLLGVTGAILNDSDTAVQLNGSLSSVTIPYSQNLNSTPFSAEAWVFLTGGTDYRAVMGSRDYPNGWIIYAQSTGAGNNWSFWLNSGSAMVSINGPTVQLNTWTHLVATFDGTNATLFVNGVQVASSPINNYSPNTSAASTIGKGQPGQGYYFPGKIDDVSYYQYILSPAQVLTHYNAGIDGVSPTPTPTPSPSPTPSSTPSPSPSSTPTPTPSPSPSTITWEQPIVTFTFDDGYTSAIQKAAPILASRGIRATAYVNTQPPNDNDPDYMTWSQIQDLQNVYNWEIGSHAYQHVNLSTLSKNGIRNQLTHAITDLVAHGIVYPESFASPYGAFNTTVNNEIARLHSSHRTSWNILNDWPFVAYDLRAMSVTPQTPPATVKGWIDNAQANHQWLMLVFHNIVDSGAVDYEYTTQGLTEVADYVIAQGIPTATTKEVTHLWSQGNSFVPNGSFENGTNTEATNWTRTDTSKVSLLTSSVGTYDQPDHAMQINTRTRINQEVGVLSDLFSIDPNKLYRLKLFIRTTNYSSGDAVIQVQEFNTAGNQVGTQNLGLVNDTTMQNLYLDYTPTPNTTQVKIFVYHTSRARLITQVDGVELKER